ncbi:dTDP-4-dehydrorhamnose 3,5-epimerase family protein [Clostridium felsineum]|uniref:dTDP-4-dehydrorhamnose 3,5-epimerase n=1 Tax=Clostridium felsineum TaxID=36839 RepID=A0A1S8LZV6_9CLOT|nr:dTDP-4-dehydrorhamnose 3,5-epimerase family protein [Clostridium felsineum]MCR3761371.1 dTDP-4-dehydrorhamnose 3,5-epimerase family protein [Clostridium felsineum]URZ05057.1 dTDP-4-dehydrorhamnose 3,5-epimerase [Clostridium felsineum]URZ10098.1 dTDP-4-dehydrorhamnose 3,5-epimerase [Clostridium felsineum]
MIKIEHLDLNEVLILEYESKKDNRAVSFRNFSKRELQSIGIFTEFVEEISYHIMKKSTLYGIHFQNNPKAQSKLLYCTKGKGIDFAVDLRSDSITYKKWVCAELNPENKKQIYIPAGFGHAFLALEDDTHLVMKIDKYFDSDLSKAITYKDTELNIKFNILNPILSENDKNAPTLANSNCNL